MIVNLESEPSIYVSHMYLSDAFLLFQEEKRERNGERQRQGEPGTLYERRLPNYSHERYLRKE
jgi:hypothetical protein